jgi:hypothetical protein
MSNKPTYPAIPDSALTPLRAIELQMKDFPGLLDRADCPYTPQVKAFLRQLGGQVTKGEYSEDELIDEITELYNDLKNASSTVVTTDAKDKVAILKTSADLLTRMVALKEKALNIREVSRFQKTVIEVLETVVTPAQRAEFIEKLGNYVNVQ